MREPTKEELEKARTFFEDQGDWLENNWTNALARLLADHADEEKARLSKGEVSVGYVRPIPSEACYAKGCKCWPREQPNRRPERGALL